MFTTPQWLHDLFTESLPKTLGTVLTAGAGALLGAIRLRAKRLKAKTTVRALVKRLVPEYADKFEFQPTTARTSDDEAGLALVSAIIKGEASKRIEVIGRGSQWGESRTQDYMRAVAEAIGRGVEYNRILVLDANLPENGLAWLLLLERFIAVPKFRGSVRLYPVPVQAEGLTHQFQLVDEKYLHHTNRQYFGKAPGAAHRAESFFAIAPDSEVVRYGKIFRQLVEQQAGAVSPGALAALIETLLAKIDPADYSVPYRWQLAFNVLGFVEQLGVKNLPPRGIELIGSLSPFTFTYHAARLFSAKRQADLTERPTVVMPFESFDEAKRQFEDGALDHLCLPIKNSTIDHLTPPLLDDDALARFQSAFVTSTIIDVDVSFVLAGTAPTLRSARTLAGVDAALRQVGPQLPKTIKELALVQESVRSNYHAGWLAVKNPETVAITTSDAAAFFRLQIYRSFKSGTTSFAIFSRHAARHR